MRTLHLLAGLTAIALSSFAPSVWAQKISMETATAQSVVGIMPQTMASPWSKAGLDVQLAMDQTLTKSLLKIAQGQLDAAVVPPPAYGALVNGNGPYAQLGDKAKAMSGNVRALFAFPASYYHAIVWADSGITQWTDAKGKRVYIGPPAGAANAQITGMARAGGLADGDYTPVKAPWGAAIQNFQDGQFDVYVGSFGLGSQALSELSLSRKVRFLSLPKDKARPPKGLGVGLATIPPGTYPGQANEGPTLTWQTMMLMMVKKDMPDDVAYKLIKTYMDNIPVMAKSNALLAHLKGSDPLDGVIAPLHPGALRYYKEAGIAVPDELIAK